MFAVNAILNRVFSLSRVPLPGLVFGLLTGLSGSVVAATVHAAPASQPVARNVILFISDGTGWQSWDAGGYDEDGQLGQRPYDDFAVRFPVTTFSAGGSYDPRQAWDATPRDDDDYFDGYHYLKQAPTDSAAAATAMATGVKTRDGMVGQTPDGDRLASLCELAIAAGRAAGVVTSVQISHATPASFAAHVESRSSYTRIGMEMILQSKLQVIMGAGHPMFDSSGQPRQSGEYQYVGGRATWRRVIGGRTDWTLVDDRQQFEQLVDREDPPTRVLGLAPIGDKLQTTGAVSNEQRTTPDLATMVGGALNVLSRNPQGFFLMVEAGASDWASHGNDLQQLVYELEDLHAAIAAARAWVEANGGWERNLVILTTDHGNGLLLGPDSETVAFQPIVNRGAGQLPEARWHTGHHVNELVRLYAHGAGSELFATYVAGEDPFITEHYPDWGPAYIDNTAVFHVARRAMLGEHAGGATVSASPGTEEMPVPLPIGTPVGE